MRNLLILLFFVILSIHVSSQCTLPRAAPTVDCASGIPLQDNAQINTGQVHYIATTGGTFSNITLQGGTLVVCGSATINNTNFNSGAIVVKAGGSITFNGSFNTGSTLSFYNYGSATFNEPVNVQGASNFVYNAPGATMQVNGSIVLFNSGEFINEGTAIAQQIQINSGATFCLGPGSASAVTSLSNDAINPVTVPAGRACLSYSNSFTGNASITTASNFDICQQPTASAPNPSSVIGSATLQTNCSSCPMMIPTPLLLISFLGSEMNGTAILEWKTALEEQLDKFIVEKSVDGRKFEPVGEVAAKNEPSTYEFRVNISEKTFFRLQMVDQDRKVRYSSVIVLYGSRNKEYLKVISNPIQNSRLELAVYSDRSQKADFILADNFGKVIGRYSYSIYRGANIVSIDMSALSSGQYYIWNNMESKGKTARVLKL